MTDIRTDSGWPIRLCAGQPPDRGFGLYQAPNRGASLSANVPGPGYNLKRTNCFTEHKGDRRRRVTQQEISSQDEIDGHHKRFEEVPALWH
jgi:hypothetical protein